MHTLNLDVTLDIYSRSYPWDFTEWKPIKAAIGTGMTELREIVLSRDYTPEGRDKELARARARISKQALQPMRDRITRGREDLAALERAAMPQRQPADLPTLFAMREIRDRLQGSDPLVVASKYYEALDRGDELFARALEEAPAAFPLLTPDALNVGRRRRFEQSPQFAKAQAVHAEVSALAELVGAAERDLDDAIVSTTRTL